LGKEREKNVSWRSGMAELRLEISKWRRIRMGEEKGKSSQYR
jgi:hypothetical protein